MIGEDIVVELVKDDKMAIPVDRLDAKCQCELCKDEQHSGDHISWEPGREWNAPPTAQYLSTLCEDNVWLCLHHIGEAAEEQGITAQEVIHGELPSRAATRALDELGKIQPTPVTLTTVCRVREDLQALKVLLQAEEGGERRAG